ncbi:MAG TPA: WD40 repeat domain-containing protein [Ktedonosporobacter sp.]|nr:WD40 repeat domain-containing protein [Ktedonosporobacter sp.]
MLNKYIDQLRRNFTRRSLLQGLAAGMLTMTVEGCAQALSDQSTATPIPTPHRPGSVLSTYSGHKARVTSVGWSPNGKYIASGSLDKTVQIWAANPNDHVQPFIYRGHAEGVQAVAWSPESDRVVSGSLDKTVQVWEALTGEHTAIYKGHSDIVMTVAWSPDGKFIASGSADGTVRVWDVTTAQQKYSYHGHQASVHTLAWSPDSQRIASGAEDKTVQIQDATNGKTLYTYHGHSSTVSTVGWSPDGKYIASGSWDKTVQVWNATTGVVLYIYNGYNVQVAKINSSKGVLPDLIHALAWSHNGKRIAAITQMYCGDICAVMLAWDAYSEQNFSFYVDMPAFAVAWSPDDTRLVTAITVSSAELSDSSQGNGSFAQIVQA